MDVSESDYDNKPETTQQEAESMAVDDFVREITKDQNVDPPEDFADKDRENSKNLDVGSDAVAETAPSSPDSTKPVESLSEELTQAAAAATEELVLHETERSLGEANGVSEAAVIDDSISKETDSASGHNGYSDRTPSQAPEGTDLALDETNGVVCSKETMLLDSVVHNVPKSVDVGESDGPEVPHSTENLGYVAVTPLSLQRTSWRDCCGLFHILRRRSDQ